MPTPASPVMMTLGLFCLLNISIIILISLSLLTIGKILCSLAKSVLSMQYFISILLAGIEPDSLTGLPMLRWISLSWRRDSKMSFSLIGNDFSWSRVKPAPGLAKAHRIQIGLILSRPNLSLTVSASSNIFRIFSSPLISVALPLG